MSNFITRIVLDKIKSGIENHANLNGLTKYDLYVKISPRDEDFTPVFALCNHTQTIREVTFAEFVGINKLLGFDVAGEGEDWIKRFLVMSASDHEIEIYDDHFYFIRITTKDELQAYMYRDSKPLKEISLDYILTTS